MSAQKQSYVTAVTWPLVAALFLLAGAFASGVFALHLLRAADSPRKPQGTDFKPQIMLITNEQHVTANLQLFYYRGYSSSIGQLTLKGGRPGTFPLDVRYITIAFSGGQPKTTLQYALLLNQDAKEANISGLPFANSRNLPQNPISVGWPGKVIVNNCQLPENTRFAQIMYGSASVDGDGTVDTQIAGQLNSQHPYLAAGNTDIVNVIEFLPTAAAMLGTIAGTGCNWLFPDSPYLGGVQWYSPAALTGSVDIGPLGGEYTVQSSNPTLEDLSSLYWEFSGPTAINYVLTDNAVTRQAGDNLFFAGVFASVAIGLGVECLKKLFEIPAEVKDVREEQQRLKERVEDEKERETEKAMLDQLVAVVREVRTNLNAASKANRPTLGRRLASVFKKTQ